MATKPPQPPKTAPTLPVEILSAIFSHLGPAELFHAQQVQPHWRTTISRSKTFRKLLFLEPLDPSTSEDDASLLTHLRAEIKLVPLGSGLISKGIVYNQRFGSHHAEFNDRYAPNPFFTAAFYPRYDGWQWHYQFTYRTMRRLLLYDGEEEEGQQPRWWSTMFFIQPPPTSVGFWVKGCDKFDSYIVVRDESGVRLSAVLKRLKTYLERETEHGSLTAWFRRLKGDAAHNEKPDRWVVSMCYLRGDSGNRLSS